MYPLQPEDDTQFLDNMAQFTSLQETNTLNQQVERLTAASYIGSTVTVNPGSVAPVTGQVTGVDTSGADPALIINGSEYPLSQLQKVTATGLSSAATAAAATAAAQAATPAGAALTAVQAKIAAALPHPSQASYQQPRQDHKSNQENTMSLIGTMDSGVSALRTYEQGLEVIGNNIANVSTNGFKGSDAHYADSSSDVLQGISASGSGATPAMQVGTGVQLAGVSVDFSQGQIATTGVPTDLAVSAAASSS